MRDRSAEDCGQQPRKNLVRLAEVDLLVIDALGLRPLEGEESVDLYEIIRLRYERGSTSITSNRETDELHQLFGDPLLATAVRASLDGAASKAERSAHPQSPQP